ncbi:hypothetical protein AMTR_s00016p00067750 [Amborella trichopoda]|uniref:Uncharacterized protein n=1 Tax=Amborella trichopoda TaxID=13333 RepID=W1PEJ3_AMBTC|nr:hypothetical protein AMTR_s00016p00067750 [Amborella trichopoda]
MDAKVTKFINAGLVVLGTSALLFLRSRKRLPPTVQGWLIFGGLISEITKQKYGLKVSTHYCKALESDLSQEEVHQLTVLTFGPDVVYDADCSVRPEQFSFFTQSLRVNKLKVYVDQMVVEVEVYATILEAILECLLWFNWFNIFSYYAE